MGTKGRADDALAQTKKTKLIVRIICVCITLLLLLISFITLGWFTNNTYTEVNSSDLAAGGGLYELAAAGENGKYDSYLNAADGVQISVKDENDNDLTLISTNGGAIKWMMNADDNMENNAETLSNGIQPGSHGKLRFYVVAKQDGTLNITFSLNTVLYNSNLTPDATDTDRSYCIISAENVNNLVKGHILFFSNYNESENIYSDRIADSFLYLNENAKTDVAYPVDIYWIWPNVADQLLLPKDDVLLTYNSWNRIIATGDTTFETDIATNSNNYFLSDALGDFDLNSAIETTIKGSNDLQFNKASYEKLNEMWNNADQKIGTEVSYIELKVQS
ncbi:MAG: hypothetical protein ACI396_08845 [Acutalibacteraceae bacterium]